MDEPAGPTSVLPVPYRIDHRAGGGLTVAAGTRIVADREPAVRDLADRLAVRLTALSGNAVTVAHDDGEVAVHPGPSGVAEATTPGEIVLRLSGDPQELGLAPGTDPALVEEAYRLETGEGRIVLTGGTPRGLRHGLRTLEQIRDRTAVGVRFPALVVTDHPRFAWRGLSLDVARHFTAVPVIASLLDVMADLRLNVLHLHLTDDQGWRLDLPSRPELVARSGRTAVDGDPGGWYTAGDYAAVVDRAAGLGITVVPEIDVPGHVNAALHADGALNPTGQPLPAYTGIEVGFSRLHADLPATDDFLRDVFTDLATLTPGPYLHIGGDEPLSLDASEYARLVGAAVRHVAATGKRVVGWQEIAAVPLPAGSVVQYWQESEGADQVLAAAARGAAVLLSPASRVYLDMKYDADTPIGLEWAGHIPVRAAYDWDPLDVLPGLPADQVIGVEAAIWTETVRTADDLFSLLLPRLAAFAEVAWSSPERRDWTDFARRVVVLAPQWQAAGLAYHRAPELPW